MAASRSMGNRKSLNAKESRLVAVADLFRQGKTHRQIQSEVMKRFQLTSYSLSTVHKDIQSLLKEWRATRIEDIDFAVQAELEKIGWSEGELVEAWLKSKLDYQKKIRKRKGKAAPGVNSKGEIGNDAISCI